MIMNYDLFDIKNFNVLEDDNYYYVFRALNKSDHADIINHFLETTENPERIRTDRERFEELHGRAKYDKDSEISLEEVYDHIKIHYLKETNCISLSSNSCVSLDYGGNYFDEYALVKVPKNNSNSNIYPAGQYMLFEIFIKIEEAIKNIPNTNSIKNFLISIDKSISNRDLINKMTTFLRNIGYEKNLLSRFQDRQYFNSSQQFEYNKLIAKATILEVSGFLPSLIKTNSDNQALIASIGMAFSSGEIIHYNDIPKEDFMFISKKMMNLLSLTQQLKEKLPNNQDVLQLERRLINLVNQGYDIKNIDGKVFLTSGENTISTGLIDTNTQIFNKSVIDPRALSIEEIYNITGGRISYEKAKTAVEFCYTLAESRKEVYDYASIISTILGNNNLINEIIEKCFIIDSKIIDRSNNNGYKVCESVNIGLDGKNNKLYTLEEQSKLISLILNLNINSIEMLLQSNGIVLRTNILENFEQGEVISKNEYYAQSIIDSLDFSKIFSENVPEEYILELKDKLSKLLSIDNVSRLYNSFTQLELSHEEISYYIFNLFIEKRLKGFSFEEICELDNIDEFVKENFSVFNRDINELTLNNYLGIFNDSNYIPNSKLCLRDFQLRIKNDVDRIHANNKRFAGVILPTGGGKSFIAMAEMLDRRDSKIVYIAPRLNILRNFKKNIVEYIAGIDPEGLSDEELDCIVKDQFPHLELICYQSLNPKDEKKLASYKADYIILDEIHHIGGGTWNRVIKKLLDNNPNSQVLGISATPQRDEYTDYQGEEYFDMYGGDMMMAMAAYLDNYSPEELLQRPYLACDINIIDAIQEGYVVCPNIVSFDYSLDDTDEYHKVLKLSRKIKNQAVRRKAEDEVEKMLALVNDAKLTGVDTVIKENIKVKNGKYILFIPRKPSYYAGTTDEYIESYIADFKKEIVDIDKDPHIDFIHSGRGDKVNLEAMRKFEVDNSQHMKILVAIDMLNEGVHLPNINGSFNFRKIDRNHLILSLQHLGRVIYALDPNKTYTDSDTPVVFDKFNNYSNLDLDRLVNKKTVTSDLEKLKDAIFWIEKYKRYPKVDGQTQQEVKKAVTLKRIQEKYEKFIDANLDDYNLSEYDKKNVEEILKLCTKHNIWNADFGELSIEKARKIERVELFNVSATQESFLDICNKIKEMAGISTLNTSDRLQLLLKVLDILAENDISLNPTRINEGLLMGEIYNGKKQSTIEAIKFELTKLAVGDNYPLGQEFFFGRTSFFTNRSIFLNYDYTPEEIMTLRRYGILSNGPDFQFIDEKGFVVSGPYKLLRKNIYTGTYYDLNNGNIEGYNKYNFDVVTKMHKETETLYNEYGFNINHIHKDTNTLYDKHGFDIDHLHKDTGTFYDERGFDIKGNWHKIDPNTGEYKELSFSKYDSEGYDIDGYNRRGFNKNNIHRTTGQEYDELFFDNDGIYWEQAEDGSRRKTGKIYNEKMFDRKGNLYEINQDGKVSKKGQTYNEYGFLSDGLHYKTRSPIDPDGFDINGIWHKKGVDGEYISTGSIFNSKGWTRDKTTLRHNVYGVTQKPNGEPFLDVVDDYGFDYFGRYHKPVDDVDKDGFTAFHKDIIMYSEELYHRNYFQGTPYDIHYFNQNGIHAKTGTFLNEYHFDRNGYYWKKNDEGEYYNTYSYFNDEGWTIDKKKFIYNKLGVKVYSSTNERGFTIDHLYQPYKSASSSKTDEFGFDYYGINITTGTHLDENHFDINGFWWRETENGELENTWLKYDDEGWSRKHVNIKTQSIRDEHGFNYLHLYYYPGYGKNKELKVSEYDPHGFNYLGIQRTTGKVYNQHHFDIDGFWYKKVGKEYIKTDSKYDDEGYDIDRRDCHGFTKNGFYKKTRKRINEKGFFANGINVYTKGDYDLDGLTIDGELSPHVNWDNIRSIKESNFFDKRMYIEEIITDVYGRDSWRNLVEMYNVERDEFDDYFDEIKEFVGLVQAIGITPNETIYTEEEILEYIKDKAIKSYEDSQDDERARIYFDTEFKRMSQDGDLTQRDIDDVFERQDIMDLLHGPEVERERYKLY